MAASPKASTALIARQPTAAIPSCNFGQQYLVVGQQPHLTSPIDSRERYKKTLRGLGITEAVLGGVSILLAVVADSIAGNEASNYISRHYPNGYNFYYYLDPTFTYISQGIWCGVFMIVMGILGILVMTSPSKCMYTANMAMAIIIASVAFAGVVISGIAAGTSYFSTSLTIIHSIVTVICFAAMIITIVHSAFCCGGVCSSSSSVCTQQVMCYPQQIIAQSQPQYVQGPNGQIMMVVNQAMPPQNISQSLVFQQSPSISHPVWTHITAPAEQQTTAPYENLPVEAPPTYSA